MAKNISTRIGLKIDTLAAWNSSTIGLLPGELAIATVAAGEGSGLSEPVIMIKVGEDGVKTFKDLDWAVHAKASDVYGWAKQTGADFIDGILDMKGADEKTLRQKLDELFITHDELTNQLTQLKTEIAGLYYNKTEIDSKVEAINKSIEDLGVGDLGDRVDALETAVEETLPGQINAVDAKFANYTTTTAQQAIDAEQDRRLGVIEGDYVKAADIANFETKENVKKVADDLDAYKTAHADDYTNDQVDAAVKVVADDLGAYKEAHKNDYTNEQVDAAIKVVADNLAGTYTNEQIDALVQGAKDYADANDANDNTTYTLGYESKVEGEGGHPARIVLTPSEGEATYVDATPFIKDGMLDNVTYDADNNTLTFTFNTDAGKEDVTVELTDILAPYSGHVGETITVTVDGNTIKAELNETVKTDIATAKADAAQAKTDAAAAVTTANGANATAGEAKTIAEGAVTTANEAKNAATEAQNSAAASAEAAEGHAADALASKNAAAQSATEAAGAKDLAVAAQGAAETAKTAAETAKGAAESAQTAAETAQAKAEAAQQAAEEAQAAAENSNTSATAIANEAKTTAEGAVSTANAAKTAADKATEDVADLTEQVNNLTTDDIDGGTEVWTFNCGTSTLVV